MKHVCKPTRKGTYEWPCPTCHPDYYKAQSGRRWRLIFVYLGVEPSLKGPFRTNYDLARAARGLQVREGDAHGYFWLLEDNGRTFVGAFNGGFFDKKGDD